MRVVCLLYIVQLLFVKPSVSRNLVYTCFLSFTCPAFVLPLLIKNKAYKF